MLIYHTREQAIEMGKRQVNMRACIELKDAKLPDDPANDWVLYQGDYWTNSKKEIFEVITINLFRGNPEQLFTGTVLLSKNIKAETKPAIGSTGGMHDIEDVNL